MSSNLLLATFATIALKYQNHKTHSLTYSLLDSVLHNSSFAMRWLVSLLIRALIVAVLSGQPESSHPSFMPIFRSTGGRVQKHSSPD
jgi:hypothetical protein